MDSILTDIQRFAADAHGMQQRKYRDEKYICHPIRVMETCKEYDDRIEVAAAALLHDVLEDTSVTEQRMRAFLTTLLTEEKVEEVMKMVCELTDVYTKSRYPQLNRSQRKQKELQRIAGTGAASQTVKYADILDNTSEITLYAPSFAPRYLKECYEILKAADNGNPVLYKRTMKQVESELAKL